MILEVACELRVIAMERPTTNDRIWTLLGQFLQVGLGIIVAPFIIRALSPDEYGLYAAFTSIGALFSLLNFGLSQSLELIVSKHGPRGDLRLIHGYYIAARRVLVVRSLWSFPILAGTLLLYSSAKGNLLSPSVSFYALAFSLFIIIQLVQASQVSVFRGIGKVALASRMTLLGRAISVPVVILFLHLGYGFSALALAALISSLIPLIQCDIYLSSLFEHCSAVGRPPAIVPLHSSGYSDQLLDLSRQRGWTSVAVYFIINSNSLLASIVMPLNVYGAYSLAQQLLQLLVNASRYSLIASAPFLSNSAHRLDLASFGDCYRKCSRTSLLTYSLGSIFVAIFVSFLASSLNPHFHLLPLSVSILLVFLYLLEVIHGNASLALSCFDRIPFVKAAWLTGIAINLLLLVAIFTNTASVFAFVLIQIICQLAYNAWKWPQELSRRLTTA